MTSGPATTAERFSGDHHTMSTTHQLPDADEPATPNLDPDSDSTAGERALSFFDDVVWTQPDVCSNCFSRLRGRMAGLVETPDGKQHDIDESWRAPTATLGERLEEPPESVATVQPLARPSTTCEECGSVGGVAQPDIKSRRETLKCVPRLVERLAEYGYDVDERTVRNVVRHLKSKPEFRTDDKHVFATAVALGVGRA